MISTTAADRAESAQPRQTVDDSQPQSLSAAADSAAVNEHKSAGASRPATETVAVDNGAANENGADSQPLPTVIDFVRNFLARSSMSKTLATLQDEWYHSASTAKGAAHEPVSSLYQQTRQFADMIDKLQLALDHQTAITQETTARLDKVKRDRDHHRLAHFRLEQEKLKLVEEVQATRKQAAIQEPTLKQLKLKADIANREKFLAKMERDKLATKVDGLQEALRLAALGDASKKTKSDHEHPHGLSGGTRRNPNASLELPQARTDGFHLDLEFRAHDQPISSLRLHPKKMAVLTTSDDASWKLWTFGSGQLLAQGNEHSEWIGDCDIHPSGSKFATASGDCTAKIWDFDSPNSVSTYREHSQPVWSCAFHDAGGHLVTASMDQTLKLWDISTEKCLQTFRGHSESVNAVAMIPYTNQFLSASGDKTLSVWDARSGICELTLYGHPAALNHVTVSLKANTIVSCDAVGTVKFWDIRAITTLNSLDCGPDPANRVALDPAAGVLAVASSSGSVKIFDVTAQKQCNDVFIDASGVQTVAFDSTAKWLVAGGMDGIVRTMS